MQETDEALKCISSLSLEKRAFLALRLKKTESGVSQQQTIPPLSRESDVVPLSFAQERLWFLDQLVPHSPLYNTAAAVRLMGQLHVAALARTLAEIVRRHGVLRTTFAAVDGQPMQVIAPALATEMPMVDLQGLTGEEQEVAAQKLATEEARRPFNLTSGPLMRATLLRLGDEDHVLLLTIHHIVSDGWSVGILIRDVSALYVAFSDGKPSPLPELPIQYADYALWQREWLEGEVLERQITYWKRQLGGPLPSLDLPTDRPRPTNPTFQGASQSLALPSNLVAGLRALGQQEEVTLFMILLAGFQTLLYRYTGQKDILVGSPIANRNRPEIEGLIGFFANTLVLRVNLSGNPTFRNLLKRVRRVTMEAYAHQDAPFENVVKVLHPERNTSRNPLFQVAFVLQNASLPTLRLPGLSISRLEADTGTAKFDLMLSISQEIEGLVACFEYSTELFDATTIVRMLKHFVTLLKGIVEHPEMHISQLPLMTHEERFQSLSAARPSNKTNRLTPEQIRNLLTQLERRT